MFSNKTEIGWPSVKEGGGAQTPGDVFEEAPKPSARQFRGAEDTSNILKLVLVLWKK